MRVLICGGRDFEDYTMLDKVLVQVNSKTPISVIISGCASGADQLGIEWAESNNVSVEKFPADWTRYGKSAGSKRNIQMLCEGLPELVIACPGGRGTAHMVKIAKDANVEVIEIKRQ